jgi:hypothetical protein
MKSVAAVVLAGGVSFCGEPPATPTTTSPSPAPILTLRIAGQTSIAPRGQGQSIAQLSAIATVSGGTTADVTERAVWTSSNFSVVHPTTKPGEMQAEAQGQAVVSAAVGGLVASVGITVTMAGTFTLSGVVSDAGTTRGLSGVVLRRAQDQKSVITDVDGRYIFFGMSGPTAVTASLRGFVTQSLPVNVTADAVQDFVLIPEVPPAVDLSGNWTIEVTASPGCRDRLPTVARERRFDVIIAQQSAKMHFTAVTPSLEDICVLPGTPPGTLQNLYGVLFGDAVEFAIVGDTGYDTFSSVCIVDHPRASESVGFSLGGNGRLTGSEIRMTMNGDVEYWPNARASGQPAVCRADDHVVVLRRQ